MSKLPVISGQQVIRKLHKVGYQIVRQKGSHVRLKSIIDSSSKPITIPLHRSIKPGLLHQIIKDANLSLEKFIEL